MQRSKQTGVPVKNITLKSGYLNRNVLVDLYFPPIGSDPCLTSLLLINDGQDLPKFHFDEMLADLYEGNEITPIFCVGIHCSAERKMEYGAASLLDYKGRGAKARLYQRFVFEELLPYIKA
ncbi:MAG TPA: esterase, partial [Chitinophagaceae bacterium]|nr:esterase [Chitinophagaceae bacterium]